MGLCSRMVTCSLWWRAAAGSTSMRASRLTRAPSWSTTLPSTFTQRFSIHSSASRREHRPSSLMRFDRRGSSGWEGDGRGCEGDGRGREGDGRGGEGDGRGGGGDRRGGGGVGRLA